MFPPPQLFPDSMERMNAMREAWLRNPSIIFQGVDTLSNNELLSGGDRTQETVIPVVPVAVALSPVETELNRFVMERNLDLKPNVKVVTAPIRRPTSDTTHGILVHLRR